MPHCIVEHANTIDGERLVAPVFVGALNSGLFEADGSDIKIRTLAYSNYQVGGQKSAFIHVSLKLLKGRTEQQKITLSKCVLAQLETLALGRCSITIEVIDIESKSYMKSDLEN